MRSVKFMLLGVVFALLGLGLVESTIDTYLINTFTFISADTVRNIFPPVSLGLILVGAIVSIVSLFLGNTSSRPSF